MKLGAGYWAGFVLKNFATPIAFYLTYNWLGAKPAIGLAIATTLVQLGAHRVLGEKVSPFFLTASGFTVLFGMIDLFLASPRYFRLEPAVQNYLMGAVFLFTWFTRAPLALWFAKALPEPLRPALDSSEQGYLRKVTLIWALYFLVKASFFLWLAFQVDLGRLIVLRSLIGGLSLGLMFGGEILYRKKWRRPAAISSD